MNTFKTALALAAASFALLVTPAVAGAQTTTHGRSLAGTPVTGVATNGKAFTGHFTVKQFITRAGKTYAVGVLTGRLGQRGVGARTVAMPVKVAPGTTPPAGSSQTGAHAAALCPVLHLDLGPLSLNLLGLNVHLNEVVLDITAQSGPGNLLGNLLCSVSNLLNPGTLPVGQVTGLLNILQQLLNTPGLLTL
ncbi:MAG TPA: hypothetical protein VFN55_16505 [Solirubrobacteraceae bacterium]|nr:hypothetical protein [Solirubrobacteraceae bacterium]